MTYFLSKYWKKFKKFLKRRKKLLIILAILILIGVLSVDAWVRKSTEEFTYSSAEEIPANRVTLLLGTVKELRDGRMNLFYTYRIDAMKALHEAGKVDFVLISGDNSREGYDEPSTMKEDLVAMGIPEEKIFLDYAGFRTLDSVVRAKEIFGQTELTVVSQKFHNERSIFIGKRYGVNLVGLNAKDVSAKIAPRIIIREKLARVKMMFDLLFKKQPKFLGERIEIK